MKLKTLTIQTPTPTLAQPSDQSKKRGARCVSNPLVEKQLKYQALIAQANYLRSPGRSDGPSRYEAEDAAAALEKEAEEISEELFYVHSTRST